VDSTIGCYARETTGRRCTHFRVFSPCGNHCACDAGSRYHWSQPNGQHMLLEFCCAMSCTAATFHSVLYKRVVGQQQRRWRRRRCAMRPCYQFPLAYNFSGNKVFVPTNMGPKHSHGDTAVRLSSFDLLLRNLSEPRVAILSQRPKGSCGSQAR